MEKEVKRIKKENIETNIAQSSNKKLYVNKKKKRGKINLLVLIVGLVLGIILGGLITVAILNKDNEELLINSKKIETEQQEQIKSTLDEMLEEEGLIIKTPVADLHYPEKWKEQIRIEQIEDEVYTVQFFATVEGKEEIHIFDLAFGETEGILLGSMNATKVYLIYADFTLSEEWNEEEQNEIYAMQEDVNYTIGMLKKEKGFVPAS